MFYRFTVQYNNAAPHPALHTYTKNIKNLNNGKTIIKTKKHNRKADYRWLLNMTCLSSPVQQAERRLNYVYEINCNNYNQICVCCAQLLPTRCMFLGRIGLSMTHIRTRMVLTVDVFPAHGFNVL